MIVSDPQIQDKFEDTMSYDNCEAVTLKFAPTFWGYQDLCEKDIVKYCTKRAIRYYLVAERGPGGNYHMHGIMVFPFEDARKRFQTWFNKQFGHFKVSTKSNAVGWFNYITKGCPAQKEPGPDLIDGSVPYLFDPKYEPKEPAIFADVTTPCVAFYLKNRGDSSNIIRHAEKESKERCP